MTRILANEAATVLVPLKGQTGKSRMARSQSQQAVRAEIEKDAAVLLGLAGATQVLEARKLTGDRLEALRANAKARSGKLADRAVKKEAKVSATKARKDSEGAQSQTWAACYRLLALVGQQDIRIAALLRGSGRK